jgi:hypothetical protein
MAGYLNLDNKRGLVWYPDSSKINKGTGAWVYRRGSRRGHSCSLGLHNTVFQAEIYVVKACIVDYTENGYTGRNIYILSESEIMMEEMSILKSNRCCEKPPITGTGKAKQSNPITGLDRPRGFQEIEAPRFKIGT